MQAAPLQHAAERLRAGGTTILVIQAHEGCGQPESSFSIWRPSRVFAGVGLIPRPVRSACIFVCFTLAR
jgi:hypothetical protein